MGETTEEIIIEQQEDKYLITRKIIDLVDKEGLLKIYGDIVKADEELRKQLDEIPKQISERTSFLEGQINTIVPRLQAFEVLAKPLKEAFDREESIKNNVEGGP